MIAVSPSLDRAKSAVLAMLALGGPFALVLYGALVAFTKRFPGWRRAREEHIPASSSSQSNEGAELQGIKSVVVSGGPTSPAADIDTSGPAAPAATTTDREAVAARRRARLRPIVRGQNPNREAMDEPSVSAAEEDEADVQ
jgi:hypothetical protein